MLRHITITGIVHACIMYVGTLCVHVSWVLQSNIRTVHCKNVRVIITLVWSSQLHLFRGFYYTRMIAVYKLDIEILIATFCFQNWWSRTAKALQSWETPNRCNSDNHSNFKKTLTFLQCMHVHVRSPVLESRQRWEYAAAVMG